ncbi:hypothetical protein [Streptomyces sp. NRRL F-5065]|uniref:hypothetical protein n=1 Tax=Streptomyces sp. NRRL F-5065 TaxID=1463855 RepID=UPI0004BE7812|nr:hypothetical protein [Streptomyces sp. NRRL F-5065]
MQTSPVAPAWPEGVIARYRTVGGATVDQIDLGTDTYWRYEIQCTGCPHKDDFMEELSARQAAQAHAETCRALPRPDHRPAAA